jgi:dTDP-4-amino-4,6-dideoxygalactose transaminase
MKAARTVPLNVPFTDENLLSYLREVIERRKFGGDGATCKKVEERLQEMYKIKHVLLTSSGTHALEMSAMLLDLRPGDEVILPSFTFVSSANAIIRAGGKPVFCDIRESTLTMDPRDCERRITGKTRAVMPVHYAGVSADMKSIMDIARDKKLKVIEDAAQGVQARYEGKYLGGIGDMGTYSFHDTKNLTCGEGGAFTTNDEQTARRAEIIREKGTNRANFLRGEVDKYTWVANGSSFILAELLAATLMYQLDRTDEIHFRRKQIYDRYNLELKTFEEKGKLRLPIIPQNCLSNYHLYHILLPTEDARNKLMKELKERGIGATFHYIPLHSSPYALESLGTKGLRLPVTESLAGRLLRLPLYPQMNESDIEYVIENVKELLA